MTENEILEEKISGQEGFMLRPQDWMKKQSETAQDIRKRKINGWTR